MKPEYKKVSFSELTRKGYEFVEHSNGSKEWYLNGKHHREDGPAVEWPDGSKAWYLNGKRHREDGPAIERPNGYKAWYLNDEQITLEMKSKNPKVQRLQEFMKIQEVLEK
jgi:hypothetical protein